MISSDQIAKNYDIAGVRKANLPGLHMLLLGFFAGMFIALAGAEATDAAAPASAINMPAKKPSSSMCCFRRHHQSVRSPDRIRPRFPGRTCDGYLQRQ